MDNPLPDMMIEPSPPQEDKRKRRPKVQGNKRKRRPKFDNEIVFSNAYLKKQTDGDELCNLVCKRRKLPQTALDMWKFNRTSQKDSFLRGPLVYGMCTNLHETYERKFPYVSDPDAESASDEHTAGVANVGDQDASPERQLNPKSPENADAPPEHQLVQKSPGNAGAQPECQLTPKPTGNADADMAPEFPRFFPQDNPSPVRENDTPFKTPGGTPQSGLGGTGATEMQAAYGSYVSTIQMTHDSDPKASPFPFTDELDGDLPEIPGLISTPGVISRGQRIKTRKRNIAAPLDPASFSDAIVQIYLDNAGDLRGRDRCSWEVVRPLQQCFKETNEIIRLGPVRPTEPVPPASPRQKKKKRNK